VYAVVVEVWFAVGSGVRMDSGVRVGVWVKVGNTPGVLVGVLAEGGVAIYSDWQALNISTNSIIRITKAVRYFMTMA
jgi:hypothetical protein